MSSTDVEDHAWTNVSKPPHKPYHVQQNTTTQAYRYRTHGWVDGLPENWTPPAPAPTP